MLPEITYAFRLHISLSHVLAIGEVRRHQSRKLVKHGINLQSYITTRGRPLTSITVTIFPPTVLHRRATESRDLAFSCQALRFELTTRHVPDAILTMFLLSR